MLFHSPEYGIGAAVIVDQDDDRVFERTVRIAGDRLFVARDEIGKIAAASTEFEDVMLSPRMLQELHLRGEDAFFYLRQLWVS